MARHAAQFELPRLLETIRLFNAAASETRGSWQPGLGLELAVAQATAYREAPPAPELAEHVSAPRRAEPAAAAPLPAEPRPSPRAAPSREERSAEARTTPPAAQSTQGAQSAQSAQSAHTAPAVQNAPSEPGEQPGEGGPGLAEIRANWLRIRAEVKKRNGLTEAALNSCRTFTLKDGVLVLGYQTDLVKKKMETEENLAMLRQAIQAVLGVTFGVRCIVVGNKSTIDSEDLEVEGDGIVRTALDMGAKIVYKE
jgi:DNA polymerase-3 subunit gamma/tau